ncbi:hypothetical protein CLU79DRAFT_770545 [Phycomyces nitens]|nr:hypothetical protein CLU79DRAFT_770545 [Phycomyces nitens]
MQKILRMMEGRPGQYLVTLRALLPPKKIGILIGKNAASLRTIETDFNVRLYFHSEFDDYGRLTTCVGYPLQTACAWRDILFKIYNDSRFPDRREIKFLVPLTLAAKLQDPYFSVLSNKDAHQCDLAEIANVSGVDLILQHEALPNTTEQILVFSVENLDPPSLDAFEMAVKMLATCFEHYSHDVYSPINLYYLPHCADNPPVQSPAYEHSINSRNNEINRPKDLEDLYEASSGHHGCNDGSHAPNP